tara:strand:+ start:26520 stop:28409 length:1890 start_codon:yes stop_codon:yes gene_type:complete
MADRPRAISKPHIYSLVAAAEIVTSRGVTKPVKSVGLLPWQEAAWTFYDHVGELRFGVGWTSNALSRVNLTAAAPPKASGQEPSPIHYNGSETTDAQKRAVELVDLIAGGAAGQGQLLGEFGQHLAVAGFGWLVAEPDLKDDLSDVYETWQVMSQDAVRITDKAGKTIVQVRVGTGSGTEAWRYVHPNALVVKVWRKHPRRPWEPDAPVRAVLGVLEQLDLLNAHVTATARSRLAGAGLLAIPAEAEFPPPPPPTAGAPAADQEQDGFDRFVNELTDMMTVPIKDRDSAAAVVPLTLAIPGEYIDKIQHITFSTPFDDRVEALQQAAIKRLALGLDLPPEVLTGMAGVNHWTAWQVEATAITLHIEPNAEVVCNALTESWLRPALAAEGYDPDTAIVWYDTTDLQVPPDKSGNATAAYDRLQMSAASYLREQGFSVEDQPDEEEFKKRVLLDAAKGAPTLAPKMLAAAGILAEEVAAATEVNEVIEVIKEPADATPPANGPPSADNRPSGDQASAIVMACDGIAYRAMERAGGRLRNAIGRSTNGPQVSDTRSIPSDQLHLSFDPTVYSDLDWLLEGAFDRVPQIADALDIDAESLAATMKAYCRSLLAAQHQHERLRLLAALGVEATI